MIKPSELVTKYAPWSISKAGIISQCPKRFDFTYINKPEGARAAPNTDALLGKAVHRAIEHALGGVPLMKSFNFAVREFKLTTMEKEMAMGFVPNAQRFMERFARYRMKHDCAEPKLELKLGCTINGEPRKFFDKKGDLFLRGAVDLGMLFNGKPRALILDHKTGKRKDISEFGSQFDAYLLLMRAHFPELEEIIIGLNFLRDGEIDFKKGVQPVKDIEPILDRVMSYLNNATKDVTDLQTVRPGPLCDWCDFREICGAHADGTNGKNKRTE